MTDAMKPEGLYVESFYLSGARQALITLHDQGLLQLEPGKEASVPETTRVSPPVPSSATSVTDGTA